MHQNVRLRSALTDFHQVDVVAPCTDPGQRHSRPPAFLFLFPFDDVRTGISSPELLERSHPRHGA